MAGDSDAAARVRQLSCGLDTTMGFRFVSVSRDEVILEYDVTDRHLQPYGIVHGGVHCAAVETASNPM